MFKQENIPVFRMPFPQPVPGYGHIIIRRQQSIPVIQLMLFKEYVAFDCFISSLEKPVVSDISWISFILLIFQQIV